MQTCAAFFIFVFMILITNSSLAFFLQNDQEMSDALFKSLVIQSNFSFTTSEILQIFHNLHDNFYHNKSVYDREM